MKVGSISASVDHSTHKRKHQLKHYKQVNCVSRPIPEDRPSEGELFGEFYNPETF